MDSDATLVFSRERVLSGGTRLTEHAAQEQGRPILIVRENLSVNAAAEEVEQFLRSRAVNVLNVAGPRESEAPRLADFVKAVFEQLWSKAPWL